MADIFSFFTTWQGVISSLPYATLLWCVWGSFGGLSALSLGLCAFLPKFKSASKRPYYALFTVYSLFTFVLFLGKSTLSVALSVSALFWVVGYLLYGLMILLSRPKQKIAVTSLSPPTLSSLPVSPHTDRFTPRPVAAAEVDVRMDHARSMTERLLKKPLGKADRAVVEKIYHDLDVLVRKGVLSPQEAEVLNEHFNTLLKLMAKYNV